MSVSANARSALERLAEMQPLSERERKIAKIVLGVDLVRDVIVDRTWYGPKAWKAFIDIYSTEILILQGELE